MRGEGGFLRNVPWPRGVVFDQQPLAGVALSRHLAIFVAAATAFWLRVELAITRPALWAFALCALLNVVCAQLSERSTARQTVRAVSAGLGLLSWAALVALTGGVTSPFVAGFALEVVFSGVAFGATGAQTVTLFAIVSLWGQQLHVGFDGPVSQRLAMQSVFLA